MRVIMPVGNFRLKCPKCGETTRYKKTHHYGPEGQYCDKCQMFIGDMINRTFPMFVSCDESQVSKLHEQIQNEVNQYYQKTVRGEQQTK